MQKKTKKFKISFKIALRALFGVMSNFRLKKRIFMCNYEKHQGFLVNICLKGRGLGLGVVEQANPQKSLLRRETRQFFGTFLGFSTNF